MDSEHLFDAHQHNSLFKRSQPAWSPLIELANYLKSLPLGFVEGVVEEGAWLVNKEQIYIGEGSVVESGAYIKGPCYIGKGCQVRHGAYLRGNVLMFDESVIGHASEAKQAILMHKAQAGHFAYIGDTILGNRVNLGAGTKCANLRFDRKNIQIKGIDTQMRKFGALIGDDAQTGCNTVTNPGTIMLPNSVSKPCSAIHGVIRCR